MSGWVGGRPNLMYSPGPGPGLWTLVLGPSGPDLGPDLDLTWDLDLDLSLKILDLLGIKIIFTLVTFTNTWVISLLIG